MIETRVDHEYAGRVWMHKTLTDAILREARVRVEAMLPLGYTYRVTHGPTGDGIRGMAEGWTASYGPADCGGAGWGLHSHPFATEVAATLGLLAVMCDGCVYPGCVTAFEVVRAREKEIHGGTPDSPERNGASR